MPTKKNLFQIRVLPSFLFFDPPPWFVKRAQFFRIIFLDPFPCMIIQRGPTCIVLVLRLWHVVTTRLKLLCFNVCATQFNPIHPLSNLKSFHTRHLPLHWLSLNDPRVKTRFKAVPPCPHYNIFAQWPKRKATETWRNILKSILTR